MATTKKEGLVVARRPGTNLMLSGVSGKAPSFEGPSHRTIFFKPEEVEADLRQMRVPPESVELRPATLEYHVE